VQDEVHDGDDAGRGRLRRDIYIIVWSHFYHTVIIVMSFSEPLLFSIVCRERVHPIDRNGVRGAPKSLTIGFEQAELCEEEGGEKVLRLEADWPGPEPRQNSRVMLTFNGFTSVASFLYKSGTSTYKFEGVYGPVVVAFDWAGRSIVVRVALHLVDELMA
jgi:hypothetical protein